jgi:hypothetical protein
MALSRLIAPIETFGKSQPFVFQNVLSVVKTSSADYIVQKGVEGKADLDYSRLLAFATLGCLYSGGFQYFIFVNLFTKWFPSVPRFTALSFADKLKDRCDPTKGVALFRSDCVWLQGWDPGYCPAALYQDHSDAPVVLLPYVLCVQRSDLQ